MLLGAATIYEAQIHDSCKLWGMQRKKKMASHAAAFAEASDNASADKHVHASLLAIAKESAQGKAK